MPRASLKNTRRCGWLRDCTFLLILCSSGYAGLECSRLLSVPYDRAQFSHILKNLPALAPHLLDLMEDWSMPVRLRRALRVAVEVGRPEVVALTDSVRARWGISSDLQAVATIDHRNFVTFHPQGEPLSVNEDITARFALGEAEGDFRVACRNEETADREHVVHLIHELAHVYAEIVLRSRLSQMVGRYPRELIYREGTGREGSSGMIHIDSFLVDFLHERIAHEMELEYVFAKLSSTPSIYNQFPWLVGVPEEERRLSIAHSVLTTYRIGAQRIRALAWVPVERLLEGLYGEFDW